MGWSGSVRGRCPWWSAAGGVSVSSCQLDCGGIRPAVLDGTWLMRVIASFIVRRRYSAQVEFGCAYFESCRYAEFYRRMSIGGRHGVVFKTRPSCSVPASLVRE